MNCLIRHLKRANENLHLIMIIYSICGYIYSIEVWKVQYLKAKISKYLATLHVDNKAIGSDCVPL